MLSSNATYTIYRLIAFILLSLYKYHNDNNHIIITEMSLSSTENKKEIYRKQIPINDCPVKSVNMYNKIAQVGEGTFGKVYKAEYINPASNAKSEIVALKKILMDNEKEGFPITAIREIMILKRLNHKNILRLIEIVTSKASEKNKYKGNVYLVFEYMEHDISGLTNLKVSFPIPAIKCILFQILQGVKYLHMNNIIHRDIKSANILLNSKGEIKVGDFGLARIINPNPNSIRKYTNRVVTLWYRAPELLFGSTNYSTPIDVWAIGCVFSELMTSVPLFKGLKEAEQVEKIFEKLGSPTEENWPGVTALPFFNQLNPRVKYPNHFRDFFKDNNKVEDVAFDLLKSMLRLNPNKRISIDDALNHEYFTTHLPSMCKAEEIPIYENDTHEFQSRKELKSKNNNVTQQNINNNNINSNNKGMIISKQNYQSNLYYNKNNPHGMIKGKIVMSNEKDETSKNDKLIQEGTKDNCNNNNNKGNILETLLSKKNNDAFNSINDKIFLGHKREHDDQTSN